MRKPPITIGFTQLARLGVLSGALILGFSGMPAIAETNQTPQQTYQEALKHCDTLSDEQARLNCQRDAGAALQEARHHPDKYKILDPQTLNSNRMARCDALPEIQKELCIKSMEEGADTEVIGSVEGGGILRKTTIVERGEPYTVPASEAHKHEGAKKSSDSQQKMPTSNVKEPLKAKEEYGAMPVH